jgi:hypothetical protein
MGDPSPLSDEAAGVVADDSESAGVVPLLDLRAAAAAAREDEGVDWEAAILDEFQSQLETCARSSFSFLCA